MNLRALTLLMALGPLAACAQTARLAPVLAPPVPGSWRVVGSGHFVVRTDAAPEVYGPLLQRLEDVFEGLSATYFQGVPVPSIDVLLFARAADFRTVAPEGLTGFFIPDVGDRPDGWMVLSADADFDVAATVAAHELAHRFLYALSDQVPTWLHEGFAKYVGASHIDGDRLVFDAGPIRTDRASPVPVERLLGSSSADFFGASARGQYLTAWLVVRRLLDHPVADPGARWRQLVARSVLATTPRAQVALVSAALGGIGPSELDRSIREGGAAREPEARPFASVKLTRDGRPPAQVRAVAPAANRDFVAAVRARARGGQ